jgi:hypothetical protein
MSSLSRQTSCSYDSLSALDMLQTCCEWTLLASRWYRHYLCRKRVKMERAICRCLCANFCCRRFTKSGATKYAATNNKRSKYRQRLQPVTLDDVAGGCYIGIRHALNAALGSGRLPSVWTFTWQVGLIWKEPGQLENFSSSGFSILFLFNAILVKNIILRDICTSSSSVLLKIPRRQTAAMRQ